MAKTSEYGKGFTYCLGMFLAHEGRAREGMRIHKDNTMWPNYWVSDWFYMATDHLYEIKIPAKFTHKKLAKELVDKCLDWRLKWKPEQIPPTPSDFDWAVTTAKELLRAWDEQCGIKTLKANHD